MYGASRTYTTIDEDGTSRTKTDSNVAPPMSIMGSTSVGPGTIGGSFSSVKPLLVTTASATSSHQTLALGNDGKFYAWRGGSTAGVMIPSDWISGNEVQAISDTNLSLPDGVGAGDVTMLFGSYHFVAMVANGNVYTRAQDGNLLHGDGGSSTTDGGWHTVMIDASTPLTNVIAVRGQVGKDGIGAVMALTSSGDVYTWGSNIYKGDGTGRTSNSGHGSTRITSAYATMMTLPTPTLDISSKVKQIGVTGGGGTSNSSNHNNSYYVLFENGELWSLGANNHKQLGRGPGTNETGWSTSWVPVMKPANPDGTGTYSAFQDVKMFSVQEHDWGFSGSGSVAAIDSKGDVYTWGSNNGQMIGHSANGEYNPQVAGDLLTNKGSGNINARYVELGGHTTAYSPEHSPQFCYVGHMIDGSMGHNTHNSGNPWQFDCDRTPAVNICGADPIGAVNDDMGEHTVPDVLTELTGMPGLPVNAYDNDFYRDNGSATPFNGQTLGTVGKVVTPATSINYGPVPYLDPATGKVYLPAGTPPGDYTIKYEICDVEFPDQICGAAYISTTVLGIKAIPDTDSTDVNTPVTTKVTENDTTPGDSPINADSVKVVTQPPNGYVVCKGDVGGMSLAGGECKYTPNPTFKGTDTYTYQVCNAASPVECDTTTVTVAVGEPPVIVANDDSGVTAIGVPL